jgi:peptidoglycan/LPS O-acetylase OafA/YrhL
LPQSIPPEPEARFAAAPDGPEGRVFHTLDALRGLAAIGVVIFHMSQAFAPVTVPGGYLAVDLFFMMSGVVLSHAYERRFRAGMGTFDFMRARLIRLYPLYILGTLLGIAVTLASFFGRNIQNWDQSSLIQAALLALFFVPNFSGRPVDQMFPLNIPCWSLFLEIVVNLLFVIFWPLLSSRRLVVVLVLSGAAVGWSALHTGNLDQGSNVSGLATGLARTIFGFAAGVLIARHVAHGHRRQSNLGVLAILLVVGVAVAGGPMGMYRTAWDAVCVLLVFPIVVCCGTMVDPGPRLQKVATFLGLTSYAIYVLHSPLSSIWNSVTRHLAGSGVGGLGAPYAGLAILAALLIGCWLVDRFFDVPVRRLLARMLPKKQTSAAN